MTCRGSGSSFTESAMLQRHVLTVAQNRLNKSQALERAFHISGVLSSHWDNGGSAGYNLQPFKRHWVYRDRFLQDKPTVKTWVEKIKNRDSSIQEEEIQSDYQEFKVTLLSTYISFTFNLPMFNFHFSLINLGKTLNQGLKGF